MKMDKNDKDPLGLSLIQLGKQKYTTSIYLLRAAEAQIQQIS